MYFAAGERDYEQATVERNRLQAVKSLLERQRVAEGGAGTYDAVAVAVEGTEANAQVFQVRDGVLSDRQSFYLENQAEQGPAIVAEEFMLQYYASALSIPPLIVVQGALAEGSELDVLGQLLAERRDGPGRDPRLRARRQAPDPRPGGAQRAARARPGEAEVRAPAPAAGGLADRPAAARSSSTRCRCGSSASTSRTSAAPTPSRRWWSSRAARRRRAITGVSRFARSTPAMISPRWRRSCRAATPSSRRQAERSPYDAERDASFAALPNLVIIDGGKGQLGAGLEPLQGFRDRGVAVVSLAKRIEEVFLPGNPVPVVMPHDTPELQLVQRVRDEAHRFAITHHRIRRDKAMTESIMDELPGIGPARKRALLKHFGSPEAVLDASREELENVPGFPQKVARDLFNHLNRTGR